MPEYKNADHFFTPTSPQNGGINICLVLHVYHFWVGFNADAAADDDGDDDEGLRESPLYWSISPNFVFRSFNVG